MKTRGFSLLEVIVVLVLISLSAALVVPSLSRFSRGVELKAAAKKVSAILRFCRSEAVNKGEVYQVLFDQDLRQIRVQSPDSTAIPYKPYALPAEIHLKEVKLDNPSPSSDFPVIEFYPNGGSSGGSILLDSESQKGYRIKVHFLTGMVEIEKI